MGQLSRQGLFIITYHWFPSELCTGTINPEALLHVTLQTNPQATDQPDGWPLVTLDLVSQILMLWNQALTTVSLLTNTTLAFAYLWEVPSCLKARICLKFWKHRKKHLPWRTECTTFPSFCDTQVSEDSPRRTLHAMWCICFCQFWVIHLQLLHFICPSFARRVSILVCVFTHENSLLRERAGSSASNYHNKYKYSKPM